MYNGIRTYVCAHSVYLSAWNKLHLSYPPQAYSINKAKTKFALRKHMCHMSSGSHRICYKKLCHTICLAAHANSERKFCIHVFAFGKISLS